MSYPLIPSCSCNSITEPTSGGVKIGGSAIVSTSPNRFYETGHGGCLVGGRAMVNVPTQFGDALECWYPMQEAENGIVNEVADVSGHNRNGTGGNGDATACPTLDSGIACENSQLFNGRAYVALPSGTLTTNAPITVSVWANINSKFAPRCFYSRGTSVVAFSFGHDFVRRLTATVVMQDFTTHTITGTTQLQAGKWYYLSVVFDPYGSLAVFINGIVDASIAFTAGTLLATTDNNNIAQASNGQWFIGNMEEVRVEGEFRDTVWLQAVYASYCSPSFYSLGSETGG